MKKTFYFKSSEIPLPRQVEAVKHEIRKYLKRERRKSLPEGFDFWDFDCRTGSLENEAEVTHVSEIIKFIDKAAENHLESFYIEILAKPAVRAEKPKSESSKPTCTNASAGSLS